MTPYHLARANLVNAIQAAKGWAATAYGLKAALSTDGYKQELLDLAKSKADEQTLKDRIAALIILYALWAYEDGLQEAGAPPEAVQATQGQIQASVTRWTAQQTTYAAGLAQAMAQNATIQATPIGAPLPPFMPASTGGSAGGAGSASAPFPVMTEAIQQASAEAVIERVGMWAESLRSLRLQGMAAGAQLDGKEIIGHWELGETDEHCLSEKGMTGCLELSRMPPMPLSEFVSNGWIPRAPGNEEITCGGYRCKCRILDKNGRQLM